MMTIEEFKRDVYNLSTVNNAEINRLTNATKQRKSEAFFLVEIIVNSIKEVSVCVSNQIEHPEQKASKVLPDGLSHEIRWREVH